MIQYNILRKPSTSYKRYIDLPAFNAKKMCTSISEKWKLTLQRDLNRLYRYFLSFTHPHCLHQMMIMKTNAHFHSLFFKTRKLIIRDNSPPDRG